MLPILDRARLLGARRRRLGRERDRGVRRGRLGPEGRGAGKEKRGDENSSQNRGSPSSLSGGVTPRAL